MKLNKKGFTLIELLAVIVILAIIMVIAVPQILNVIQNSRVSAWDNNVKLVEEALDLNTTLGSTPMANFDLASKCSSDAATFTTNIKDIAKISADDTEVTCTTGTSRVSCTTGTYEIKVKPKAGGQFANVPEGTTENGIKNPAYLCY